MESQADKGDTTQNLFNEKENTIKLLKKKINIPSTKLIQASELTKLEKEKEGLNGKLENCKSKLLKFAEKEKKWKQDMTFVVESQKTLKVKFDELEKKLQEKEKELECRIIPPSIESSEQTIFQAMSLVNLN